jgi:SAM-dependent methyltransferase
MNSLTTQDWHKRFSQQAGWTKDLRKYLLRRANLDHHSKILDVGCGTGAINKEFQEENFIQYGLDINLDHLKFAAQIAYNTPFCQGDAHSLPFDAGTFDLVFCHFLLMWIQNPVEVLREMARVTQFGGKVIAFAEPDYGGRIDYPDKLTILGEIQIKSLQQQGANPMIGRQLAGMFNGIGLHSVEMGVMGGQWSGMPDWDAINAEWQVIESDISISSMLYSDTLLEELKGLDIEAYENNERLLYVPTFYACGTV